MTIATVSAREMAEIDRIAQSEFGISQKVLMDNAGAAVSEVIESQNREGGRKRILILCGSGNNGGDGITAAGHLLKAGFREIALFLVNKGTRPDIDDHIIQGIRERGIRFLNPSDFEEMISSHGKIDIIVDAVFGTGFQGPIRDFLLPIFEKANRVKAKTYSVDIPSGLDATSGQAFPGCLKADFTVTFGIAKKGFFINDGPRICGHILVKDIGFPEELINRYRS